MLELKNVTKTFGTFKALDGLTLTVPKGAVYGLVGPNGAGKSTAIRHMTGVYRPDNGEVTLGGEGVYENTKVKETIGYIPDEIFFFPSHHYPNNNSSLLKLKKSLHRLTCWNKTKQICKQQSNKQNQKS